MTNSSFPKGNRILWIAVLIGLVVAYFSGYYYNRFVILETQLLTNRAQIDVQLQMRKDLLINLAKTVIDYAEHERELFKYIADQRLKSLERGETPVQSQPGAEDTLPIDQLPGKSLDEVLDELIALAENYPQLKLSSNFEKLMQALVDIEQSIAKQRMMYNEACNQYTSYIQKFPQMIFAFCYGYDTYPFAEVDEDAGLVNRVEY